MAEDAPAGRPRLNLKPRDDSAAAKLAAERDAAAKPSPFGAAKPREAILAARTGKKEEDILKEEAAKDRLHVSFGGQGCVPGAAGVVGRRVAGALLCGPRAGAVEREWHRAAVSRACEPCGRVCPLAHANARRSDTPGVGPRPLVMPCGVSHCRRWHEEGGPPGCRLAPFA